MLHCLRGRVRLTLESGDVTLEADDWLYLEAAADHGVEGLEDSEILLTILFERSTG